MSNSEDKCGQKTNVGRTMQAEGPVLADSGLLEQRFRRLEGRGEAREVT